MKPFLDFIPILLFFVFFKFYDIYVATGILIGASLIQSAITYKLTGRLEKMQLITVAMIVIFGGFTLLLHDEAYIKAKPTVLYLLFAVILIAGTFTSKNFIERLLSPKLPEMPKEVFKTLNILWITFFIFTGCLNYYVAENYSTDIWVNFKLFGLLGFTLCFVILQALYIMWYIKKNNIELEDRD